MALNQKFAVARQKKDDEYYTRIENIDKELKHYIPYIEGKVIYSNCDHSGSAFNAYLGSLWYRGIIKRYICTGIDPYTGDPYYSDTEKPFNYIASGDYSRKECIDLLQQADVVITNPPFSRFSYYLSFLEDYKKQYLIIGYYLGISYKYTISLLMRRGIRTGYSTIKYFNHISGERKAVNALWLTNLPVKKHFALKAKYAPDKYHKIQGYDIINVDNVHDIPADYNGLMAVPQSALIKLGAQQYKTEGFIYHPVCGDRRLFNRYLIRLTNER